MIEPNINRIPEIKLKADGQPDIASIVIPPADVSGIHRKWLDITYAGKSPAQQLDIYIPDTGEGPFPAVLHLHGGGFMIGDKRDMSIQAILKQSLAEGYAVVSVNYRLSGEAVFPAGLQDIKAAIRWVRANQGKYHLNGRKIAAWGGSAGGNYTAMVCLTAGISELEDLSLGNEIYPCDVQAGVDWFGPTDFLKMDEQLIKNGRGFPGHSRADSPESMYIGCKITEAPEKAQRANPINYIHNGMPPMLIQHGRLDEDVPVQQSIMFAEKLREKVSPDKFEFEILEEAKHGDPLFETEKNLKRVFRFLNSHLK
jgi:acetyl esterase/lipase